MTPRDKFCKDCEYYRRKCRKRLFRIRLLHAVTMQHFDDLLATARGPHHEEELREALENQEIPPALMKAKFRKVMVESRFLILKVNFEYFLNRMLYCLWDSQFERLSHLKTSPLTEKVSLRDLAQALSGQSAKDFVIDEVIPRHGLDRMAECYKKTTGTSLQEKLNEHDRKLWNQIHSAFEVRHLIEHCKGRIDRRFMVNVASQGAWQNSSWSDFPLDQQAEGSAADDSQESEATAQRQAQPPRHPRIEVREKDFKDTIEAMIQAVEIITRVTRDCWVE